MPRKKKIKLNKIGTRRVKNPSEYECYLKLKDLCPNYARVEYETEDLEYIIRKKYKPDFPIRFKKGDGTLCYIEYKGNGRAFSDEVRQKMIAVKEQYPDRKFYIVFHSNGKIGNKRRDGSYRLQSDWAEKYGFEYCIGINNIPFDWFR